MTINCFPTNYIGLRGDCATYTTTGSGLFINDLPQLSLKLLSNLTDEEQKTASEFYQICHAEGLMKFKRDFKLALADTFLYKNILNSHRDGRLTETFTGVVGTQWVAKELELVNCYDRYQCLYLEYFEYVADSDFTLSVKIIDDQDEITSSHEVTAGRNRIQLNYEARSTKITLAYNATGVNMPDDLLCWNTGSNCVCGGGCGSDGGYRGYKISDVESAAGSVFIDSNIENGISIAASVRCSGDELVCIFQEEAAAAVRYAIAIDILRKAQSTDRENPLVRSAQDNLDELLILWDGGKSGVTGFTYKGEYHKEIKGIAKQAKSFLQSEVGATDCLACEGRRIDYLTP